MKIMRYIFTFGVLFIYGYANINCNHFKTTKQAQAYYDKKLIGYEGLLVNDAGKVCTYLRSNDKKYYTLKIIRKNAPSTYSQVFLSKNDCEGHKQMLLKQSSGSGNGYKCVEKPTTKTEKNGIYLMKKYN